MPLQESKLSIIDSLHVSESQNSNASETIHRVESGGSSDDSSIDNMQGPSKRKRLSGLTQKAKATTKKILKIRGAEGDHSEVDEDEVPEQLEHNPAFAMSKLRKPKKFRPGKKVERAKDNVLALGNTIIHPIDGIKRGATRTTAGQLSKADRPYLSREADLDFLGAHDKLKQAESTRSSQRGTADNEQDELDGVVYDHRDRIKEMKAHRESLKAAWTTSRHVRRVRVVPKQHIKFPEDEYFVERDDRGNTIRYDWLKWLGLNLIYYTQDFSAQYIDDFDELPFDIDSTRHYAERLVQASAPWQSWAMNVRATYRWEKPLVTTKWFAVYLFGWYFDHMVGLFYCYIVFIVLKNRYAPESVESLRDSVQKNLDSRSTASKFGELVDKHGRNDWLEPVMEHMGPFIQLQLGDMANMLEVFSNFYHWKHPRKTAATLIFFVACFLVTLLADMNFCMHIFWFICGGAFFLCWPISSIYPKYRYLVSPFKWVLWDIPTDAEWSFQYLRRQAQITREELIKKRIEEGHWRELANPVFDEYSGQTTTVPKIRVENDDSSEDEVDGDDEGWYSATSTTSVLEASDIRAFRAQYSGSLGRLIVSSKGIRFVRSLPPRKEHWRCDYLDLAEMRKAEGSTVSKITSGSQDQLEIKCIDGSKLNFEGMKERDEAFNTIIAFSSLQWQSLQILSNTKQQP